MVLYNVRDNRTNKIHSIAVVSEKHAKYFVPADKTEHEPEERGDERWSGT